VKTLALASLVLASALAVACARESEPYEGPPIPWPYEPFPEVVDPFSNVSTPEKVELGRLLFYDPVLSRDEKTACGTCHSEVWGLADGLPLSVGVDGDGPTGPGREGPNVTTRNAQTLWNVAFREQLFWDGRTTSLEAQALEPILNDRELDMDLEDLVVRLNAAQGYRALFRSAFPDDAEPVSPENVARALAAFQRSFVSDRAPYDLYVNGDENALSTDQRAGMELFAEAGCASCHVPPLFESPQYAQRVESGDRGRESVSGDPADRGKLRVPTLRNLRETGPYFHDGSTETLEEAVAREAETSALRGEGGSLTEEQAALVALFVRKALMDRTREPTRPNHVPSGLAVPKDGFRIPR
jgi:cytochrome c peroxidase